MIKDIVKIKHSRKLFTVLCIMGLFAILSSTMSKNPVLKPFTTSLGTPTNLIGFVASASTIPGILISLPASSLSDRVGRRKMLLISGFIFSSAPFLYLFVSSWWQLIPVRFYHGFATAIFIPVAEATIAETYPTKRGERISIFSSVTAVGRAAAPFLGGYILFLTNYGYSALYLTVTAAGTLAFMIVFLFLAGQKSTEKQNVSAKKPNEGIFWEWIKIAKNRKIQLMGLIQASQYYVFGAVEFFLVGFLSEIVGLDPFSIGIAMGSQIISIIAARPIMGILSDRVGRPPLIVIGSIISGLILALFPFSTNYVLLLILSVGYGVGFAAVVSSTAPLVSEIAPSNLVGTSMGFLSTTMDVGQTLGPIISGIILALTFQYNILFYSFSIILMVSSIFFGIFTTQKLKHKLKSDPRH